MPLQVEPELKEAAFVLVDDLLKLPEGKLVTSKAKKSGLKWLDDLTSDGNDGQVCNTLYNPFVVLLFLEIIPASVFAPRPGQTQRRRKCEY